MAFGRRNSTMTAFTSSAIRPIVPARIEVTKTYSSEANDRAAAYKNRALELVFTKISAGDAAQYTREQLTPQIREVAQEIIQEDKIAFNSQELDYLVKLLLDDMLGLGPLEPLLVDDNVTDIMVNGYDNIYVETAGKIQKTDVKFRDDKHVMQVAQRIVNDVGRRVDESNPMVDARLKDGSRVNIVIPPLALKGPTISIRKFSRDIISLDTMVEQGNISPQIRNVLEAAARCRLNILISGGTGSGKTTLLNAMSQMIDSQERIITIEDAAELQLRQPHVVSLETKPANLEGNGQIKTKDLLINALRMRPDRIIVGEVRSDEVVDMLQAMNTGHDGSLGTIHANNPREAFTRLENMVMMSGINLPSKAIRTQIAQSIDLVVQIERMKDGKRRVTRITEVIGMENEVITAQDLFVFKVMPTDNADQVQGQWQSSTPTRTFIERAEYYNLGRFLKNAVGIDN